jgi:hypothetical protein
VASHSQLKFKEIGSKKLVLFSNGVMPTSFSLRTSIDTPITAWLKPMLIQAGFRSERAKSKAIYLLKPTGN